MRRGRRDPDCLRVGEALDFWRVEAVEPDHLIRLRAEMKVPGRAWLQFHVHPQTTGKSLLSQTAYFAPKGVWGLIYWYGLYPIHKVIFAGMIRKIAEHAVTAEATIAGVRRAQRLRWGVDGSRHTACSSPAASSHPDWRRTESPIEPFASALSLTSLTHHTGSFSSNACIIRPPIPRRRQSRCIDDSLCLMLPCGMITVSWRGDVNFGARASYYPSRVGKVHRLVDLFSERGAAALDHRRSPPRLCPRFGACGTAARGRLPRLSAARHRHLLSYCAREIALRTWPAISITGIPARPPWKRTATASFGLPCRCAGPRTTALSSH